MYIFQNVWKENNDIDRFCCTLESNLVYIFRALHGWNKRCAWSPGAPWEVQLQLPQQLHIWGLFFQRELPQSPSGSSPATHIFCIVPSEGHNVAVYILSTHYVQMKLFRSADLSVYYINYFFYLLIFFRYSSWTVRRSWSAFTHITHWHSAETSDLSILKTQMAGCQSRYWSVVLVTSNKSHITLSHNKITKYR